MKLSYKRCMFFLIRFFITLSIIFYLSKKIDFHYLWSQLPNVNLGFILLAILLASLSYILMALRWRVIIKSLNKETLTKRKSIKLLMIGMFFNQFMLASVGGDAVRIWLATRNHLSPRIAINSTLFDRLFGLSALMILIAACLPIYRHALPNQMTFISLSVLTAAILVAFLLLFCLDRIPLLSNIVFLKNITEKLSQDARTAFLRFKNMRKPITYSAFATMLPSLIAYLIARAYHLPVTLLHALVIIPPVMLVSMIPISIAGWGVREGSMIVVAGYLGIASSEALLISLWLGTILLIASLPGALFWLLNRNEINRAKTDYESNAPMPSTNVH